MREFAAHANKKHATASTKERQPRMMPPVKISLAPRKEERVTDSVAEVRYPLLVVAGLASLSEVALAINRQLEGLPSRESQLRAGKADLRLEREGSQRYTHAAHLETPRELVPFGHGLERLAQICAHSVAAVLLKRERPPFVQDLTVDHLCFRGSQGDAELEGDRDGCGRRTWIVPLTARGEQCDYHECSLLHGLLVPTRCRGQAVVADLPIVVSTADKASKSHEQNRGAPNRHGQDHSPPARERSTWRIAAAGPHGNAVATG